MFSNLFPPNMATDWAVNFLSMSNVLLNVIKDLIFATGPAESFKVAQISHGRTGTPWKASRRIPSTTVIDWAIRAICRRDWISGDRTLGSVSGNPITK